MTDQNQLLRDALQELLDECEQGIATCPLTRAKARAALAHHPEPARVGVPEGWKLVPVEPTWDMKMAASSNYREPRDGHYTARMECATEAYRAMLTAAPQAPADVVRDVWAAAANWLRNNYQDHTNIASLCDAMREFGAKDAP